MASSDSLLSPVVSAPPQRSLLTGVPEALTGILIFSLTAPTMRIALQHFDPTVVGVGRMVIGAIPAAIVLGWLGFPRLTLRQWGSLATVVGCLAFGFSWLTAAALRHVPSHHAAIVIGGIPLATAIFSTLRDRQRQRPAFWLAALLGSGIVMSYGFIKSGLHFSGADGLLLLAAAVCGLGYVEGARLGRQIGTSVLTCLVPLTAAPFAILLCAGHLPADPLSIPFTSWAGLVYNGLFSTFVGFLFWYRGLSRGGVARIGQLQLVQPFLSLLASYVLLRETMSPLDWLTAGCIVACIAATQAASTSAKKTLS